MTSGPVISALFSLPALRCPSTTAFGTARRCESWFSRRFRTSISPYKPVDGPLSASNTRLILFTATDIAAGRRPNRATSSLDIDSDIDLSEYQVSSSDSETSCASSSGNERIAVGPTSELQELISAIKGGLDSLFRISVFIRKFAAQDRRQRASRAKPFDNRADIMYIKDRYPALAEKNEGLAIRLGEANSRRRQYFKYRRDHNDRLSTIRECQDTSEVDRLITRRAGGGIQTTGKTESVVTGRTAPSLFADTEATAFVKGEVPESQVAEPLDVPAAMSVVSFATSIAEASEDELPFPPLPPEADGRSSFMCPYCLTVVQMKKKDTEHQWRFVGISTSS
ncbi:unnamed protein product [Aspergillus oryzae]|nr:unnamed protein product [Aspergillus oryzae]